MHEGICEILLGNDVQSLYVTNKAVEKTAQSLAVDLPSFHCEASISERIAFELAFRSTMVSKRTACLVSSEGLYETLDLLVDSAYMGVAGGFLIVAVQENDEEVTPLGPFSKLPVLVTEDADEFTRAVEYGYYISEKYKMPVVIQTKPLDDRGRRREAVNRELEIVNRKEHSAEGIGHRGKDNAMPGSGIRDQGSGLEMTQRPNDPTTQWVAAPKFTYELHKELNDKIEKIRAECEGYEGNKKIIKSKTGLITDRLSFREYYDDEISVLKIATVYPLPEKLIMDFIGDMDGVFLSETYPAMEFQIPQRSKVGKGPAGMVRRGPRPEETIYGFHVVRDKLGPASSINMAHGIKKLNPKKRLLAITYENFFLHSGMPAFANTIRNGSIYVLLVMSNNKEEEIRRALDYFDFRNCYTIASMAEVERFKETEALTVLFCKGIG